jgi:hypothetical protein
MQRAGCARVGLGVPAMAEALDAVGVNKHPLIAVRGCVGSTVGRILPVTVEICEHPAGAIVPVHSQRKHVVQVRDERPDSVRKVLWSLQPRAVHAVQPGDRRAINEEAVRRLYYAEGRIRAGAGAVVVLN